VCTFVKLYWRCLLVCSHGRLFWSML